MEPPDWAIAGARAAFAADRPHALPSVLLAQTIDESGWYKTLTGTFNFSGIKAMKGHPSSFHWTHEKGNPKAQFLAFRDFASPAEAFATHADLLEHSPGCADYRAGLAGGVLKAVYLLAGGTSKHPRYATADAKVYGDTLASLIRGHNLTRFDHA